MLVFDSPPCFPIPFDIGIVRSHQLRAVPADFLVRDRLNDRSVFEFFQELRIVVIRFRNRDAIRGIGAQDRPEIEGLDVVVTFATGDLVCFCWP